MLSRYQSQQPYAHVWQAKFFFFFFFVDIGKIVNGEVTLDDFSKNPVKGRRKVFIHLKYGENKFVSNMYYVPNMKK